VSGKDGANPGAVIFDAIQRAKEIGADVVLVDTAGRLHTKSNLMDELTKVSRTMAKAFDGAPHETLLVLDATNGQNALAQAAMFKEALPLSGIVLTKLDGTAKGGVILGICAEQQLAVRYIGIGERAEDLREFNQRSSSRRCSAKATAREPKRRKLARAGEARRDVLRLDRHERSISVRAPGHSFDEHAGRNQDAHLAQGGRSARRRPRRIDVRCTSTVERADLVVDPEKFCVI
jgi:hypothetical protein